MSATEQKFLRHLRACLLRETGSLFSRSGGRGERDPGNEVAASTTMPNQSIAQGRETPHSLSPENENQATAAKKSTKTKAWTADRVELLLRYYKTKKRLQSEVRLQWN